MPGLPVVPMEIEESAAGRLPRWDPGVRGGVPEVPARLELTSQYLKRFPSFTQALNAAILEVGTPGAVVIPARNQAYALTGSVKMRSGVVVRGEGPAKTRLDARLVRAGTGIEGSGFHAVFGFQGEPLGKLAVVSGVEPGDRALELDMGTAGQLPQIGQYLLLTMENDPAHGWDRFDWERRVRGQVLQITGVDANLVTLDAEVRLRYPLEFRPEVELFRAIEFAGLEDLRIVNDRATEANWSTTFWRAANCWLRNCEIERVPDVACWMWNSRWITVEGCYVHGARDYGGGHGYGVDAMAHTSDSLVANNIFEELRHSMIAQFGASGNVFAYNASMAPAMSDLSLHGWYPYMNLFEGNAASQAYADNAWGRSGEFNTFFRNRLKRFWANYEARFGVNFTDYVDHSVEFVQVDPGSDHQNVLANTLLDSHLWLRGCRDTWVEHNRLVGLPADGTSIFKDEPVTNTVDIGNGGTGGESSDGDPFLLRPSLYLDAAPDFWVTDRTPWPATGADVDGLGAGIYIPLPAHDRYTKIGLRYRFGPYKPTLSALGRVNVAVGEPILLRMVSRHGEASTYLRYIIDWGDRTVTATGWIRSGLVLRLPHTWGRTGSFEVTCRSKDQHGAVSTWSDPLKVQIT